MPISVPEPGWQPIPIEDFIHGRSFISGQPKGERLRVSYYRREADGAIVGHAWFGPEAEGPPGHAHGGSISGVLDEAMGVAAWLVGHPVVAAQLSVDFVKMVPLGTMATFETWLERASGRKIVMRSRLLDSEGAALAEARGLFVSLPPEKLRAIAAQSGGVAAAWLAREAAES